ncbi:MAG: DUF6019 family protein [Hominimerdicola sp.]
MNGWYLLAFYFIIKWAVKKGIKEAHEEIGDNKTKAEINS